MAIMAAVGAHAEIVKLRSNHDVSVTVDRLEQAVTKAGGKVFARVNHAVGAQSIGEKLAPEELLIFGNPKIGTPAMQDDPLAGLFLPLKVLAYEDVDRQTWLAYETPGTMMQGLSVPEDAPYLTKMTGALEKLTEYAANE